MKHHKLGFLVIFVSSLVILSTPAIHAAEYDILATIAVGTGPFGIAFDSANNRMYVTNFGSNNVSVIDAGTPAASTTTTTTTTTTVLALITKNVSTDRHLESAMKPICH